MIRPIVLALCALSVWGCGSTPAAPAGASSSWRDCQPTEPCASPYPVRVVLVTMFEIGADSGDAPGEFQLWKARRALSTRVPFPQGHHDLFLNEDTGVLGMVTGIGTAKSSSNIMALGLDNRFDLSKAYWLVAGIAGIDPEDASIGSVAWSAYLVDGDLAHEIDPREIPPDWPHGYFARRTDGPNAETRPESHGELFVLNKDLRDWAFELTRDMQLPDSAELAAARAPYVGFPNARKAPFVLSGGHIAAMTFWHGERMSNWANDWVRFWSDGATDYVTSAMEDTGTAQALHYLHEAGRADRDRLLVLRAGSNFTRPPPGGDAAAYLLRENDGYAGMRPSLENLVSVGGRVIDTLLGDWPRYREAIPE